MPELSSKHLQNSRHICYTVIVAREYSSLLSQKRERFQISFADPAIFVTDKKKRSNTAVWGMA